MSYNLFGTRIQDTYQRLLQITSGNTIVDGNGADVNIYVGEISGGTFFSASTPLETIIYNIANSVAGTGFTGNATYVQPGLNTFTGGTQGFPTINVSALTINSISVSGDSTFTSLSANTLFSGSTPLESIIYSIVNSNSGGTGGSTFIQNGLNTYTGGTFNEPTVNISALTISALSVSGSSLFTSLSATSFSANTLFSGSTPLESVIYSIISGTELNDITRVQPGVNTYTGGSINFPTINISAATLTTLTVSGNSTFISFSATSLSAETLFSGSTEISQIFDLKYSSPYRSYILTAGTSYNFSGVINTVSINKIISSNTQINLPSSPSINDFFVVKDRKGDSKTNPITISGGTKNIDGGTSYIISVKDKPSLTFLYDGEEYIVI